MGEKFKAIVIISGWMGLLTTGFGIHQSVSEVDTLLSCIVTFTHSHLKNCIDMRLRGWSMARLWTSIEVSSIYKSRAKWIWKVYRACSGGVRGGFGVSHLITGLRPGSKQHLSVFSFPVLDLRSQQKQAMMRGTRVFITTQDLVVQLQTTVWMNIQQPGGCLQTWISYSYVDDTHGTRNALVVSSFQGSHS